MTDEERERRRVAERGFWREMQERGLERVEALFVDEHYERLNEIRLGLITAADKEGHERRVREFLADIRSKEIAGWRQVQDEFKSEALARTDRSKERR
jgi:hypothetical protein